MKKLIAIVAAFYACGVLADAKTWVGGEKGSWHEGANWDPAGVPAATDDVLIDGAVEVNWTNGDWAPNGTVTVSGGAKLVQIGGMWPLWGDDAHLILDNGLYDCGSAGELRIGNGKITIDHGGALVYTGQLTRGNGSVITLLDGSMPKQLSAGSYTIRQADTFASGDFTVGNELQPQNGVILAGANWTCKLFAPQTANSVITARSGSLTFTGGESYNGFYQAGTTHLDFPADSTCSVTLLATAENIYAKTFGSSKYTYAGERIDQAKFNELFEVTVDGAYATLTPIHVSGEAAEFASVSLGVTAGKGDGTIDVLASFTKTGDPQAVVYFVWGSEDHGRKLVDWGANVREVGVAYTEFPIITTVDGLPERTLFTCRLIAVSGEAVVASAPVVVYTRDYGVSGTVNEWTGAVSSSLTEAGNWKLGHTPTADEIRWFETGSVEVSGNFVCRATDAFKGTNFTIENELQTVDGVVFDGGTFVSRMWAPQQSAVFTCHGGTFTVTGTGNDGFWAPGTTYCNIPSGSTAQFTFAFAKTNMSGTINKFRYNGTKITNFDDPAVWTVIENETDPISTTFYLTPAAEGAPELGEVSATVDPMDATLVTIRATLAKVGGSQPTSFAVNYGLATDQLTDSVNFTHEGDYEDGTTVEVTLPALAAKTKYFYQVVVVNAADKAESDIGSFVTFNMTEGAATWLGTKSSNASNPANWSTGKVPGADDAVEIYDVYSATEKIEWDVLGSVASWHQESFSGKSVMVEFATTKDTPFAIAGDVELLSGSWVHQGPADEPTKCLNVTIGGNLTVGAAAKISSGRNGYRQGPGASVNYGTLEDGDKTRQLWTGGSYAGDAGHPTYTGSFVSYGSIVNPLDWGSAGKGDSTDGYAGAGLLIVTVGGALTVDGEIEANGFGYNLDDFAGASGGTVNVTAKTIAGEGKIMANGGNCNCGPGGGGRIRVALTGKDATFESFGAPDHIVANSGTLETGAEMATKRDTVIGAAGTVTLVAGDVTKVVVADTCASVRTPTTETLVSATHLPASANPTEELKATEWELLANGKLRLTANVNIGSLTITDTTKQKVFLDGHMLQVSVLTVAGQSVKGVYTAAELNALLGAEVFSGEGSVIAGRKGLVVVIK